MAKIIPHSRPTLTASDVRIATDVIRSYQLSQGPQVKRLEKYLAAYHHRPYAVAVNSGLSALHLALLGLGVQRGDEVILPSYACVALLHAVDYVQAKPVLVDVNQDDFNISEQEVRRKLSKKTRALIVPHAFGYPVDIRSLKRYGVPVIEDCAQAIGARFRGIKVGSMGDVACFSFYTTKMVASGEGGAVVCRKTAVYKKMLDLRDYDEKKDYQLRYNYKLTDIQAALALNQLKRLKEFITKRHKIAKFYNKELGGADLILPPQKQGLMPNYFRYIVQVKNNHAQILKRLNKAGIQARKPIFKPLHYYLGLKKGFSVTENLMKKAISLPIYPTLSLQEARRVIQTITS